MQAGYERCLFFSSTASVMKELCSVSWSGNLCEFLYLCFGLGPAPRIFTKLLKIPMSVLRRINIRIVIYLDDILIMGQTMKVSCPDTVIFLLQHLGFALNLEKSILNPVQEIEFLGVTINSLKMCVFTTRGIKNSESMSGHSFQRSRDSSCYLIFSQNILTIWTKASKGSWGAVCQGIPTGGE